MDIKSFLDSYELHDSGIDNINFSKAEQTLSFLVELCNFMQHDYREGDETPQKGNLTFHSVKKLDSSVPLESIIWDESISGECLSCKLINIDENGSFELKILIKLYDFKNNSDNLLIIGLTADNLIWSPL
jgi:hypothetical protein